MTLPRLRLLWAHWRRHPRIEWFAEGYFKFKAPRDRDAPSVSPRDAESSAAALAAAFGLGRGGKTMI